jgi:hypothetical protein
VTTGVFHCPACGGDREFRLRRHRGWRNCGWRHRGWRRLGGLPLVRRVLAVPAGSGEPSVECRACAGRFSPAVLDVPTSARLEDLVWRGTRTAAVYVLTGLLAAPRAGRGADDARLAVATLRRVLGPDYGPEVLSADLAAHREGSDLHVLAQLAPHVSAPGRTGLLRGLADLVLALDRSSSPDWSRLGDVATALGIAPGSARAVVEEAWARARE